MKSFSNFLPLLLAITGICGSAVAENQTSAPAPAKHISEVGENLGVQIRKAHILRADIGKNGDGKDVMYTVVMGAPAVFSMVDVNTGDVLTTHPMPGASGAWAVHVATDNSVYLGAYNKGHMYRFVPGTGEFKNLGFPFPTQDAMMYPMASTPDGKVYGGSYPSGNLYEFDPKTEKFKDLGPVTETSSKEHWLRVTTYDPETHKLYIGAGNIPQLIEYDIATGSKRDLLPKEYSQITSVHDMDIRGEKIFARKETNNPYEFFILNKRTGEQLEVKNADTGTTGLTFLAHSRGVSPKSPVANKVYFTGPAYELFEFDLETNTYRSLRHRLQGGSALGFGFVKLNDPDMPGYTLVGPAGHRGNIFKYNIETDKLIMTPVDLPSEPVIIHAIHTGPDGNIYTGGFLSGNIGVYNPSTGKNRVLPDVSQSEGITSVNNKIYLGAYPGARIYEYDLSREWNRNATPPNPEIVLHLEYNKDIPGYTDQDRPFAMAGAPDLKKLVVGTVPKNSMHGGALAIYDAANGGEAEIYWNIVPDQSFVSAACKDGIAYLGGSIQGGLGSKPKAKEAALVLWDIAGKKKIFETVPVPGAGGITALHVGPDGNIWGWGHGTLFIFDPETRKVIHSREEFPNARGNWIDGSLVTGKDGNVYGTINRNFVRIDADTKKVTVIATGARQATVDNNGNFYTYDSGSPYLFKIKLP